MPRPGLLEARLVVAQHGAGLSLLWCAGEGYRVQDIEARAVMKKELEEMT